MVDLSRFSRDLTSEAGARFIYYTLSGIVIVFLSRQLPPSEYGLLFLAISVLTVFRLFSSLGLAKSAAKHVSYYLDSDDRQVRHVLLKSLKLNLVSIIIVATSVVFGAEFIANALGNQSIAPLLVVGSLYVVFATLYNYARVVLQGFKDIFYSAAVYASEGIGRAVGVLVLVILGYGMMGALFGYILGFALAAVIGFGLLYMRLPSKSLTDTLEEGLTRRIVRYSLPLTVTRGAWVLDREIDIILVGYFLNPAIVGYYALSKQIVTFCTGPAGSLGFTIGPQFNEESVANGREHARNTYETVLIYLLLFYIPAVAGLVLLAEPLVTMVFDEQYRSVVPILQVFGGAIVLRAVTESAEDILDYLGRADSRATFKIVTSVGNVGLSVLLILSLGAIGAAVATVCMQAAYAGLCLYEIRSELEIRAGYLLRQIGQIIGITAVMSGVVFSLTKYVDGALTIAAVILSGVIVWGLLAAVGGFLPLTSVGRTALRQD